MSKKRTHVHPLAVKLVNLKHELFVAGLFLTAQKMEEPIKQIGWEIAEFKATQTFSEAENIFAKNKKYILAAIKEDNQGFSFPPSFDKRNPNKWGAPQWRWFIEEKKKQDKLRRQKMRRQLNKACV